MPPDIAEAISGVLDIQWQCEALAERLAIATVLFEQEGAGDVVRARSGLDPHAPFVAQLGGEGEWIAFERGVLPSLGRSSSSAEIVDIAGLSARDPQFRRWLEEAISASGARANAVRQLGCLFRAAPMPTRSEAAKLERWRSILEKPAYKLAATITRTVDQSRRQVVSSLATGTVRRGALVS